MPKNSILKSSDGRYIYRVTGTGGKRYTILSRKGEKRRDFSLRCDDLDRKAEGGSSDRTLDSLFYLWITSYAKVKCSIAYTKIMRDIYKKHVSPRLGGRKIDDIRKKDVYLLLVEADKAGYSSSTVRKIRTAISAPYAWAERSLGEKVTSPTQGLVYKTSGKKETKRDRIIPDDDLYRFLKVSDKTKYRVYFRILATTGLRPSEGLGLQIQDIDGMTLHIRRGVTMHEMSGLKTGTSRRDIPLTAALKSLLMEQAEKVAFLSREGWLFPSGDGAPSMSALKSCFTRCLKGTAVYRRGGHNRLKKLGILTPAVSFSLYDFRHTFATKMAEKGMGAKMLQTLMGHSDISTTLSYYIGVTQKMKKEAVKMMEEII